MEPFQPALIKVNASPGPSVTERAQMQFDFEKQLFIIILEVTRACSLACRHCRAEANLSRYPLERTTNEALRFIDQVERCRPVLFVMTGGDPFRRLNLELLIRYATDRGLRVSLSPSATPEFARADLSEFQAAGVERISLSLDPLLLGLGRARVSGLIDVGALPRRAGTWQSLRT